MDSFTTCICQWLWQLLHYLVSLFEFCLWLRLRIIAFILWSYDLCLTQAERERNEYRILQQCKKHLNKIPKHLNLIIGPDNTQVNDEILMRIFSYALHMNISCISYYDTRYTNPTKSSILTDLEKLNCPKGWKRKNIDAHHSMWYICKDESMNGINGKCHASKTSSNTNGHLPNTQSSPPMETACLEVNK